MNKIIELVPFRILVASLLSCETLFLLFGGTQI